MIDYALESTIHTRGKQPYFGAFVHRKSRIQIMLDCGNGIHSSDDYVGKLRFTDE